MRTDDRPRAASAVPARLLGRLVWLAFAAVLVVFVWQAGTFSNLVPRPPEPAEAPVNAKQFAAASSRFTGFDNTNQPYRVEAASALQDAADANKVHLDGVSGELNRQTGEKLELNATGGLYDSKARLLDLQGGVRMQSEGRFSAEMDRARVDVAAKTIRSEVPVTVTLPSGVIAANGMEITDDGKRILFFNRVKVTLRGSGASKGTTAP